MSRRSRPRRRLARLLPWWLWMLAGLAAIGAAERRLLAGVGIAGAVIVVMLMVRVIRHRRVPQVADWQHAERLAAEWLRAAGCRNVALTAAGADGGIDVMTDEWAVQVKHRSARTGRPAVQQIIGAALAVDRSPAIVSTSGFTAPAVDFADDHDVALIELDASGHGHRVTAAAVSVGRRRSRFLR